VQNCAEHTDPGLLTVLARGTAPGLEVEIRDANTATPCCSRAAPFHPDIVDVNTIQTGADAGGGAGAAGGGGTPSVNVVGGGEEESPANGAEAAEIKHTREWLVLEPLMAPNQVVVLVGETLTRAGNTTSNTLTLVVALEARAPRKEVNGSTSAVDQPTTLSAMTSHANPGHRIAGASRVTPGGPDDW
jgi:isopenicillin N synthase-like dioxygenase